MSQALDLKQLERLAFRRTYQDGLYDIYLGGILISFAVFAFTVFPGSETKSLYSPALSRPWSWLERTGFLAGQENHHPAPHRIRSASGAPQAQKGYRHRANGDRCRPGVGPSAPIHLSSIPGCTGFAHAALG